MGGGREGEGVGRAGVEQVVGFGRGREGAEQEYCVWAEGARVREGAEQEWSAWAEGGRDGEGWRSAGVAAAAKRVGRGPGMSCSTLIFTGVTAAAGFLW